MRTKKIQCLFLFLVLSLSLFAQRGQHEHRRPSFDVEKHHKERADFISKELNLTEAERTAFIPLMNEYIHARFALNKEMRDAIRDIMQKTTKTSSDYQLLIDKELEMNMKEVELQKMYYKKFGEVLSAEKVFKYGYAEKKFTKRAVNMYHRDQKDKE